MAKHLMHPLLTAREYAYLATRVHNDLAMQLGQRLGEAVQLRELFQLPRPELQALARKLSLGLPVLAAAEEQGALEW